MKLKTLSLAGSALDSDYNPLTTNGRIVDSLSALDRLVTLPANPCAPLNIVTLYDDAETREWARTAYERVARLAGKHPLRPAWWKLNNLFEPGVLAAAVSTAMRADVIIVAMRSEEGLPLPFYAWVNNWLPHRLQQDGALLAFVGKAKARTSRSGRIGTYLKTVADQGRLRFFLIENKLQAPTPAANGADRGHVLNGHTRPINGFHSAGR